MGNFFDALYDTFSQTDSDNIKKIASQIGGQYKSAGALKGQQILVEYSEINILYDIVTISKGNTVDTRIRAEFKSHIQYHLVMNTKVWTNFFINIYGWKAAAEIHKYPKITLSDELLGQLSIHGTNETITASLFDEKAIKLLAHSSIHTFQIHCDGESGKLYSMIYGGISDPDAFLKIHHVVCSLIDRMKEQKMIDTN
ncbi:MAG: hypothetical protein ABF449_09405 [Ethanoligenens sp.]